jgi:hypothetical protein
MFFTHSNLQSKNQKQNRGLYLNKKPLKEVVGTNWIVCQTFPQNVNLILSQLKFHWRNLDGEDDAQELKPHLDLGQVIEVGRRFTAFAISSETK